jgi:hypothetical protein
MNSYTIKTAMKEKNKIKNRASHFSKLNNFFKKRLRVSFVEFVIIFFLLLLAVSVFIFSNNVSDANKKQAHDSRASENSADQVAEDNKMVFPDYEALSVGIGSQPGGGYHGYYPTVFFIRNPGGEIGLSDNAKFVIDDFELDCTECPPEDAYSVDILYAGDYKNIPLHVGQHLPIKVGIKLNDSAGIQEGDDLYFHADISVYEGESFIRKEQARISIGAENMSNQQEHPYYSLLPLVDSSFDSSLDPSATSFNSSAISSFVYKQLNPATGQVEENVVQSFRSRNGRRGFTRICKVRNGEVDVWGGLLSGEDLTVRPPCHSLFASWDRWMPLDASAVELPGETVGSFTGQDEFVYSTLDAQGNLKQELFQSLRADNNDGGWTRKCLIDVNQGILWNSCSKFQYVSLGEGIEGMNEFPTQDGFVSGDVNNNTQNLMQSVQPALSQVVDDEGRSGRHHYGFYRNCTIDSNQGVLWTGGCTSWDGPGVVEINETSAFFGNSVDLNTVSNQSNELSEQSPCVKNGLLLSPCIIDERAAVPVYVAIANVLAGGASQNVDFMVKNISGEVKNIRVNILWDGTLGIDVECISNNEGVWIDLQPGEQERFVSRVRADENAYPNGAMAGVGVYEGGDPYNSILASNIDVRVLSVHAQDGFVISSPETAQEGVNQTLIQTLFYKPFVVDGWVGCGETCHLSYFYLTRKCPISNNAGVLWNQCSKWYDRETIPY